jgi:hypothetical protein
MIPALSISNEQMVLKSIFTYTEDYLKNYDTSIEVKFMKLEYFYFLYEIL